MPLEIKIVPPRRDKPGFLRRVRRQFELQQRLDAGDPEAINQMIADIIANAEHIEVPDGVDVRDAILDMSRQQWDALMAAMRNDQAVDPQSGA